MLSFFAGLMVAVFSMVVILLESNCTCQSGRRPNVQDMIFVFQLGMVAVVVWIVVVVVSFFRR